MENLTLRLPNRHIRLIVAFNMISISLVTLNIYLSYTFFTPVQILILVLTIILTVYGTFLQFHWKIEVEGDKIIVRHISTQTYGSGDILYAVDKGLDMGRTSIILYDKNFKRVAHVSAAFKNYHLFEDALRARNVHFVTIYDFKLQRKKYRAKTK